MRGRILVLFVISLFILQNVVGISQGTGDWGINRELIEGETLEFTVNGATNTNIRWSMVLFGQSLPIPKGKFSPSSVGVNSVTFTVPPVNSYSGGYYQFKVRATDISDNTFAESNEYMTIRDYVQDKQFGHECLVIDTGYCSDISSQGVVSSMTRVSSAELYSFGPATVTTDLIVGGVANVGSLSVTGATSLLDTAITGSLNVAGERVYNLINAPTMYLGSNYPVCGNILSINKYCTYSGYDGGEVGSSISSPTNCANYNLDFGWSITTQTPTKANCYYEQASLTVSGTDVCLKDGTNCQVIGTPTLQEVTTASGNPATTTDDIGVYTTNPADPKSVLGATGISTSGTYGLTANTVSATQKLSVGEANPVDEVHVTGDEAKLFIQHSETTNIRTATAGNTVTTTGIKFGTSVGNTVSGGGGDSWYSEVAGTVGTASDRAGLRFRIYDGSLVDAMTIGAYNDGFKPWVGIGTNTPQSNLDVNGRIKTATGSANGVSFGGTTDKKIYSDGDDLIIDLG